MANSEEPLMLQNIRKRISERMAKAERQIYPLSELMLMSDVEYLLAYIDGDEDKKQEIEDPFHGRPGMA